MNRLVLLALLLAGPVQAADVGHGSGFSPPGTPSFGGMSSWGKTTTPISVTIGAISVASVGLQAPIGINIPGQLPGDFVDCAFSPGPAMPAGLMLLSTVANPVSGTYSAYLNVVATSAITLASSTISLICEYRH